MEGLRWEITSASKRRQVKVKHSVGLIFQISYKKAFCWFSISIIVENKISMKKWFASRFFWQNNQTRYNLSFKRRKRTFSKEQNIKPTNQRTLKCNAYRARNLKRRKISTLSMFYKQRSVLETGWHFSNFQGCCLIALLKF